MVLAIKILQFIFCACAQTRMYDFLFTLGSMSAACSVWYLPLTPAWTGFTVAPKPDVALEQWLTTGMGLFSVPWQAQIKNIDFHLYILLFSTVLACLISNTSISTGVLLIEALIMRLTIKQMISIWPGADLWPSDHFWALVHRLWTTALKSD